MEGPCNRTRFHAMEAAPPVRHKVPAKTSATQANIGQKIKTSGKVKVTTAGQQYLRVVAPKSKKAKKDASGVRGFVGWRWLDLTTQPRYTDGSVTVAPATIAGTTYAKAITLTAEARVAFNVTGVCDTFKGGAGVKDGIDENATLVTFVSTSAWGNGYSTDLVANTPATALRQSIVDVSTVGMDAAAGVVTAVNPTAHCTVNRLAPMTW